MSWGVYVLGGKCPEGKCPGGMCPRGKCRGVGYMSRGGGGGFCPVTVGNR